jgi:hypothetical protein
MTARVAVLTPSERMRWPVPQCVGCHTTYDLTAPRRVDVEGNSVILCTACIWTCSTCRHEFSSDADVREMFADVGESCENYIEGNAGRTYTMCERCADDCGTCMACDTQRITRGGFDGEGLCESCHDYERECAAREQEEREEEARERNNPIGAYHNQDRKRATRPVVSPWTLAHRRLIGVENEVECGSRIVPNDAARAVLDAAHPQGWQALALSSRLMFCEHDGSLDDGFELITQPMGLDTLRELWARVLGSRAVRDLRSHDTETCGLHVHVSRAGLSQLTIAKAVCFLNADTTDRLITLIARRNGNGFCKKKIANSVRASDRISWDRYERLNLTNDKTVEFRIFRGTTNYKTLIGSVEFCHNVLEFCAQAGVSSLTLEAFIAWLYSPAQKADSVELRALIARRLDGPTRKRIGHLIPATKARTEAPRIAITDAYTTGAPR